MCHFVELRFNGRVYGGMVMTMDICPDRRIAIDVFTTVTVPKDRALALDQHDRFVIGRAPCLHLRKGMPDVPLFSGDEGIVIHMRSIMGRLTQPARQHFLFEVPALGKILLYLVVVVLLGAILSPPIYWMLHPAVDFPFYRYLSRVTQVTAFVLLASIALLAGNS